MTTTPEKGKYQCMVCGKVWDSSELVQDPSKFGWNWVCGDYFCGANVMKLNEKNITSKKEGRRTKMKIGVCCPRVCRGFRLFPHLLNCITRKKGDPRIYRWLWWNWSI